MENKPIDENNDSFNSTDALKNEQKLNILKNHEIFKLLSNENLKKISEKSEIVKTRIGTPLASKNIIQDKILILLKGEGRLLSYLDNKQSTIAKLIPGSIVGLSSLLRCEPCESVIASTEIVALSIPDKDIVYLYENEKNFKDFCQNNVFINELIGLTETIIAQSSRNDIDTKTAFNTLVKFSKIEQVEGEQVNINDSKRVLIIGSKNIKDKNIGDIIQENTKLNINPPFQGRILSIPKELYKQFFQVEVLNKKEDDSNIKTKDLISKKDDLSQTNFSLEQSNIDLNMTKTNEKNKLIRANGNVQEMLATIQMLFDRLDVAFRKDNIEKYIRDEIRAGKNISIETYASILSSQSLIVGFNKIPINFASRIVSPSLVNWEEKFLLITDSSAEGIELASPKEGFIFISMDTIKEKYPDGIDNLIVQKTATTPEKKFSIEWFLPSINKHRNTLLLVLFSSFIVQLFGLANPLLIQVIIDKVISQRSLDTLQVLGIALVVVTLLGGFLGGLKTFLFTETTNRIDTRLGSEIIDHLLRLPLSYFDKRPVGELSSRIAELEKIRNFLTGQALTTILDAAFSVIYIVVMFLYSSLLTLIALGVVPIQILITLLGAPLIRRQIRSVANQNARTQSHLVEVLTGIQTVKAQNVETKTRWKWQELYAAYISRTFEKTISLTTLSQISQVLQQLSQLLVLWVGASLVLKGELTLGQLIAFRIISGYVTQPILRLSNIWQSIQELKVSFERLADIVDTPRESSQTDQSNIQLPSVKGKVEFKDLSFKFQPSSPNILKNINLKVEAGQFVGIAGQSGSGKSTLMKLLPRLYELDQGKIIVDGFDVSKVELYSLRRQIGIVPQDPLLFSGSISENISVANPESSSEEIIRAAKIANAHDFIMELPTGYSTSVGERGANLSGGQRQRIAIARTVLSKPNLLILDEATSALDYQTERSVCENLKENCKDNTVFFITHRLTTIKNADLIIMMNDGYICEKGTHKDLMDLKGRYYALYRQQEAS